MEHLHISFEDGALEEFKDNFIGGKIRKFAGLDSGTIGGNPSLAIAIEIDDSDGQIVVAQTTWRLLYTACLAYQARWGIPI